MRRTIVLGLCAAATLVAAGLPGAASATPCLGYVSYTLHDAAGARWNLGPTLNADSSALEGSPFRPFGAEALGEVNVNGIRYNPTTLEGCNLSADGREESYPEVDIAGLKVAGRISVANTLGFARWLVTLRNPTAADVTVQMSRRFGRVTKSGSAITATSSGDAAFAEPNNDAWDVTDAAVPDLETAALADIFDGPGAAARRAGHVTKNKDGTGGLPIGTDTSWYAIYDGVTVPAGATLTFLHVAALRATREEAAAAAPAIFTSPEVFGGLSAPELDALQNWDGSNNDGDGVARASDNCPFAANADQADADKDGAGDACDADADNDTLGDAAEAARGTNRLKADTDADGIRDDADACPTVAGKGANGCPRFDVDPDTVKPTGTLKGVKGKVKLATLRKRGVRFTVTPSEAVRIAAELDGPAKRATIARTVPIVLAAKQLGLRAGGRAITLKPDRKLLRKGTTLTLVVRLTDASGNATTLKKSIRVT